MTAHATRHCSQEFNQITDNYNPCADYNLLHLLCISELGKRNASHLSIYVAGFGLHCCHIDLVAFVKIAFHLEICFFYLLWNIFLFVSKYFFICFENFFLFGLPCILRIMPFFFNQNISNCNRLRINVLLEH